MCCLVSGTEGQQSFEKNPLKAMTGDGGWRGGEPWWGFLILKGYLQIEEASAHLACTVT